MATKKAKGPKKPAKKAAAKKPAKKAAAKKPARKAAAEKPARKAAAEKPARKAAAEKPARKAAAKKAADEQAGSGKPVRKTASKNPSTKRSATPEKGGKKRKSAPKAEAEEYRPTAQIGPDGILILSDDKFLLRAYYGGHQIPSPMPEGFLMLLGVQSAPDGGGAVLFECSASSLRCQLSIPRATPKEKSLVKAAQKAGDDPNCPRHEDERLVRAGKDLMCRLCGISYGKV